MSLTERDASILTQVAFYQSTNAVGEAIQTDEGKAAHEELFSYLRESLLGAVKTAIEPYASVPAPAPQQSYDAEAALRNEFNATSADGGWVVEVAVTKNGGQKGPLPGWLLEAAQAAGCRKVFDNRGGSNPKAPWFKAADGTLNGKGEPFPFWPPK